MYGVEQLSSSMVHMPLKFAEQADKSASHELDILNKSPEAHREIQENELKAGQHQLSKQVDKLAVRKEESLSLNEKIEIQRLQQVDRSVREHEQAHLRAARDLAVSRPTFQYERGPDGVQYAVHGEVNIDADISPGNAGDTVEKALKIQSAALAPNDPSPKDMRSAVQARIIESKAHRRLSREESLEVVMSQIEKRNEDPDQDSGITDDAAKRLGLSQYKENLEFQKNLSTMLDLFT
jgi:SprA-related family